MTYAAVFAYILVGLLFAIWNAKVDEHIPPLFIVALWLPLMLDFGLFCLNEYILELGKRLRK